MIANLWLRGEGFGIGIGLDFTHKEATSHKENQDNVWFSMRKWRPLTSRGYQLT